MFDCNIFVEHYPHQEPSRVGVVLFGKVNSVDTSYTELCLWAGVPVFLFPCLTCTFPSFCFAIPPILNCFFTILLSSRIGEHLPAFRSVAD